MHTFRMRTNSTIFNNNRNEGRIGQTWQRRLAAAWKGKFGRIEDITICCDYNAPILFFNR
jgi:hypothetical protein